jgi:hypothetical protein
MWSGAPRSARPRITWLLSDDSANVSGEILPSDGGRAAISRSLVGTFDSAGGRAATGTVEPSRLALTDYSSAWGLHLSGLTLQEGRSTPFPQREAIPALRECGRERRRTFGPDTADTAAGC